MEVKWTYGNTGVKVDCSNLRTELSPQKVGGRPLWVVGTSLLVA